MNFCINASGLLFQDADAVHRQLDGTAGLFAGEDVLRLGQGDIDGLSREVEHEQVLRLVIFTGGDLYACGQTGDQRLHARFGENVGIEVLEERKLGTGGDVIGAAAAEAVDDGDEKADPMLMDAIEVAIECNTVSTSLLQRRLSLGYARAARIIDKMERKGYIGEFDAATKKRNILITREQFAELKMNGETKKEGEDA
jgi:DNA segregation ATPase FtsK/SpoIIIE-like protein